MNLLFYLLNREPEMITDIIKGIYMGFLSLPKPGRLSLPLSLVAKRQFHNNQLLYTLKFHRLKCSIFCKEQSFHYFKKKNDCFGQLI